MEKFKSLKITYGNLKRIYFFLISALSFVFNLNAQFKLDSLEIYYNQGKFDKVLNHANKNIDDYSKITNKENIGYYFKSLDSLTNYYKQNRQNSKAELILIEASTSNEKVFGPNSFNSANSLNDLGLFYLSNKNYTKAKHSFKKALNITEQLHLQGNDLKLHSTIMNNLGFLFQEQGEYAKSESLLKKSIDFYIKLKSDKKEDYISKLVDLATTYFYLKKYKLTESLYLEIISRKEKLESKYDNKYFKYISTLGYIYFIQDNYLDAENTYKKVIELHEKYPETGEAYLEISLNSLAYIYYIQGKNIDAKIFYLKLLDIITKTKGKNNEGYYSVINKMASVYRRLGEYSKAEEYYLISIEYSRNNFPKNDENQAICLSNLALLYESIGKNAKAEKMYMDALKILKLGVGEYNMSTAQIWDNLAQSLQSQEKYIDSERFFLKALSLKKEILGQNHSSCAKTLNNLSSLYMVLNRYYEAEKILLEALDIKKNTLGVNNYSYGVSLQNLSSFYEHMGAYDKSLKYMEDAFEISKRAMGVRSPNYISDMVKLAQAYYYVKNYEKSEELYLLALTLEENILDKNDILKGRILNNMGALYQQIGRFDKSEKVFLNSLEITKNNFGENSVSYAILMNNLAWTFATNHKFIESENLYLKSLEIFKELRGVSSEVYNQAILSLSRFYLLSNNLEKARPYINESFKTFKSKIIEASLFTTSEELLTFRNKYQPNIITPLLYLDKLPNQNKEINIGAFENELFIKNLTLRNQKLIKNSLENKENKELIIKYKKFVENKKYIYKLESDPMTSGTEHYKELVIENLLLEKEISNLSKSFDEARASMTGNWYQIAKKLQPQEAIINFVDFHEYDDKGKQNELIYGAFILKSGINFPIYKTLFNSSEIKGVYKTKTSNEIDSLYSSNVFKDFLIKPIQENLKGIKTLYIVPSAFGHEINFSAIRVSDAQTLGDKYKVHVLGSSVDVLANQPFIFNRAKKLELILYGDIDYDNKKKK